MQPILWEDRIRLVVIMVEILNFAVEIRFGIWGHFHNFAKAFNSEFKWSWKIHTHCDSGSWSVFVCLPPKC